MQSAVDPHDLARPTAIRTAREGGTRNDHASPRHREVSTIMTGDRGNIRNAAPQDASDDEPQCGACGHARRVHMNQRGVCFECRTASNFRPHAGWCNRYRKPPSVVCKWTGRDADALRRAARMSVRSFAEYLGISARAVSRWAKLGTNAVPRPYMQAILDTPLTRADESTQQRFDAFLRGDSEAPQ